MSWNKEIELLTRLYNTQPSFWAEITQFLIDLKLMSAQELVTLHRREERISFLRHKLNDLQKQDKLLLVSFDWTILPTESAIIYIVSEREGKEFRYSDIT